MPRAANIARFWGFEGVYPECMACGLEVDEWNHLERAHLIDRSLGGLDVENNLVLLCAVCHRAMPSFGCEHGWHARAWIANREDWQDRFGRQIRMTEAFVASGIELEEAVRMTFQHFRGL